MIGLFVMAGLAVWFFTTARSLGKSPWVWSAMAVASYAAAVFAWLSVLHLFLPTIEITASPAAGIGLGLTLGLSSIGVGILSAALVRRNILIAPEDASARRFLKVLRFELRKAAHSRLTWVSLVLPAVLAVVSVWISELVRRAEQMVGGDVERISSAFTSFSRGASNGFILGAILLLFYGSMLIANEGSLKTFKTIMLRAHSRSEWVFGKFSVLLLLAAGLVVSVVVSSLIAGAVVSDYVDIAEEGYVIYEAAFMRASSLRAVLLVLPPLVALASFALMVSTMTDHTGIAAAGCIGSYIFLEAMKSSVSGSRYYLFNTFMPSLLDTSYFGALRGFAEGLSDAGWEESVFLFNVATPLVSALAFLIVAVVVFRRRDFVV